MPGRRAALPKATWPPLPHPLRPAAERQQALELAFLVAEKLRDERQGQFQPAKSSLA